MRQNMLSSLVWLVFLGKVLCNLDFTKEYSASEDFEIYNALCAKHQEKLQYIKAFKKSYSICAASEFKIKKTADDNSQHTLPVLSYLDLHDFNFIELVQSTKHKSSPETLCFFQSLISMGHINSNLTLKQTTLAIGQALKDFLAIHQLNNEDVKAYFSTERFTEDSAINLFTLYACMNIRASYEFFQEETVIKNRLKEWMQISISKDPAHMRKLAGLIQIAGLFKSQQIIYPSSKKRKETLHRMFNATLFEPSTILVSIMLSGEMHLIGGEFNYRCILHDVLVDEIKFTEEKIGTVVHIRISHLEDVQSFVFVAESQIDMLETCKKTIVSLQYSKDKRDDMKSILSQALRTDSQLLFTENSYYTPWGLSYLLKSYFSSEDNKDKSILSILFSFSLSILINRVMVSLIYPFVVLGACFLYYYYQTQKKIFAVRICLGFFSSTCLLVLLFIYNNVIYYSHDFTMPLQFVTFSTFILPLIFMFFWIIYTIVENMKKPPYSLSYKHTTCLQISLGSFAALLVYLPVICFFSSYLWTYYENIFRVLPFLGTLYIYCASIIIFHPIESKKERLFIMYYLAGISLGILISFLIILEIISPSFLIDFSAPSPSK
ncbi:hypothetical protein NEFER03_0943 [Nematocida sp. LUAm3]|nr:hypothetical protein NEFER03_0943 [Nematocida sp. LUAm3]KAI5174961.1 hypothetical protein NEFER02_1061 [Nematocida sp. LUAm2]KAI5177440.1 hypothetical protein NEFER01_0690 [Nematocida sp. LUAm1]